MQRSQLDFPFQSLLPKKRNISPTLNLTLEPMLPAHYCRFFKWLWSICVFLCFKHKTEDGIPAHVCDAASPHHPGDALYCNDGEGKEHSLGQLFFSWCANILLCVTCINLLLQSWWEWEGMQNSDLWYNCRFDNFTGTWLCASSKETGMGLWHLGHMVGFKSAD